MTWVAASQTRWVITFCRIPRLTVEGADDLAVVIVDEVVEVVMAEVVEVRFISIG